MSGIEQIFSEGRLIRGQWSGTDSAGRELLCLYTAMAGDAAARPESCPARLAPQWIAYLMPWWDEAGSADAWPALVRRVAALAPRFVEIRGESSVRLDYECRAIALRECLPLAGTAQLVVERVLALCDRRAAGDVPSPAEWKAAGEGAAAEAEVVAVTAVTAAAASWGAREVTGAAAEAAAWVVAAWRAWASWEAGSPSAVEAAAVEVADRITAAQLAVIERFMTVNKEAP